MTNLSASQIATNAPHFVSLNGSPQDQRTRNISRHCSRIFIRGQSSGLDRGSVACCRGRTKLLERRTSNRPNTAPDSAPRSRRSHRPRALFGLGSEAPPESIPLEPLKSEEDLDAALKKAEEEGHALLIDWMATWCRKCIYLLPKMEKLSSEFQDVKFYMVNVNEVPGALVKRGGIQKMPTIQLWRHNEKVGEVIGGHKAWMVMDEIREMIKNDGTASVTSE